VEWTRGRRARVASLLVVEAFVLALKPLKLYLLATACFQPRFAMHVGTAIAWLPCESKCCFACIGLPLLAMPMPKPLLSLHPL